MASHMEEVSKLLGVKLEEEFCTTESSAKYKLTQRGLLAYDKASDEWRDSSYTLTRLLARYTEIELAPWKPKIDEVYYIPRPDSVSRFATAKWQGGEFDVYRYDQDLVCKSASEAINAAETMLAALQEANDDE